VHERFGLPLVLDRPGTANTMGRRTWIDGEVVEGDDPENRLRGVELGW